MSDPSSRPGDREVGVDAAAELASSLAQARERLAFYESFDSLIQDNIRQSGELLRLVAAERERTEQRLATMQRDVDAKLAAQATVLRTLAASLGGLQSNVATINQQVGEALAQLEAPPVALCAGPAAGVEIPGMEATAKAAGSPPASLHAPAQDDIGVRQRDSAALSEGVTAAAPLQIERGKLRERNAAADVVMPAADASVTMATPGGNEDSAEPRPASATGTESDGAGHARGALTVDVSKTGDESSSEQPARRRLDLIIRGVPRAAAALSIQRYLQDLPMIEAVEVREYVAGVLRFQLEAAAFEPGVLAGWGAEAPVEIIAATDQVVELQYPE